MTKTKLIQCSECQDRLSKACFLDKDKKLTDLCFACRLDEEKT